MRVWGGSRQGQPCILKIVGKVQKKKGKKKMRQIGKVSVPKEAFREFLKQ